jgi:hypothetical protein
MADSSPGQSEMDGRSRSPVFTVGGLRRRRTRGRPVRLSSAPHGEGVDYLNWARRPCQHWAGMRDPKTGPDRDAPRLLNLKPRRRH